MVTNLQNYEIISKKIAKKVFNKEFSMDSPLPNEPAMQELFSVGRSTVRDAIKHLSSKGILSTRTKVGTTICDISNWNFLDPQVIDWMMNTPFSDKMKKNLMELRRSIEPDVSAIASIMLSDELREELESVWKRMEEQEVNFDHNKWSKIDLRFHEILYTSTNNFLYTSFFNVYKAVWLNTLFTASSKGETCHLHHRAIYESVMRRDPGSARSSCQMLLGYSQL